MSGEQPSPGRLMQEFTAGAQTVHKELLVRRDDGVRQLLVGVDERRQHRLSDLFNLFGGAVPSWSASARWNILRREARAAAIRLDLEFREPLRVQLRLLFSVPGSIVVEHGADADHLCLLSTGAFAQLERNGVCGREAIVIPMPSSDELVAALETG